MKAAFLADPLHPCRLFLLALLFSGAATTAAAEPEHPAIKAIRLEGTNVVVTANVPRGIRRLILESRERFGDGSWEPRAVTRSDGSGGETTFRLPRARQLELLRVRADTTEPLPGAFYAGTNSFLGQPSGSGGRNDAFAPAGAFPGSTAAAPADASREVVESDIWKVKGQTLYFFNQLRGLQVIDITNPDSAVLRGTLALPAVGEQMYLLDSGHVVLLARNGCYYDQSQVLIALETNGGPTVVARLPVQGYIQESRMVGSALYVASQTYRPVPETNTWEWGTLVSSFDLADPNSPLSRDTLWYPGYGNVVAATDIYLFVVTQDPTNWWQSIVRVVDITPPDGTMRGSESIRVTGRVPDKFKLNYSGGIFTSITEDWHWDNNTRLVTKLETFRLADPRSLSPAGVIKLGELELGRGERLHATRFDGDRVYVVTFSVPFRLDPLWIVNLSDPAHPAITGQLEIPGWSTYLQPLDHRLLALGIETNQTTVSLFDVANPAQPVLLSRVALGSGWSWSEANNNEKAFSVLPDANLILVPYQSWFSNSYVMRVQLVDLLTDSLEARGVIEHDFQPRRSTVYADRILSVSARELLSVDAADRDLPVVRGKTELAWPVDRVFLQGDYVIEVANGYQQGYYWFRPWFWGDDQAFPVLRVARASDPNIVVSLVRLTNGLPVLGATVRDGHLYIAQGQAGYGWPPYLVFAAEGTNATDTATNPPTLFFSIYNLANLPDLRRVGQLDAAAGWLGSVGSLQAVWPKPGVLVWAGDGGYNFWRWFPGPAIPLNGFAAAVDVAPNFWWPSYYGGGKKLFAFDVTDPAAPAFGSSVTLNDTNGSWWSFSKVFSSDGSVYLSHQGSEFVVGLESPWQNPAYTNAVVDPDTGETNVVIVPAGTWVSRAYLDVVDYGNPGDPTVRQPVNISGTLNGISHQGELLYTVANHWTTNWSDYWSRNYLEALAYDGVSAHLVDSLLLSNAWQSPLLVVGTNIFLGQSGYSYSTTNVNPHTLETWTLSAVGKWTQLGSVTLTTPANMLATFPGLLAVQEGDNTLDLFDVTDAAVLKKIGQGKPPGCLWFDLGQADGEAGSGLWLPLGTYGVATVPSQP